MHKCRLGVICALSLRSRRGALRGGHVVSVVGGGGEASPSVKASGSIKISDCLVQVVMTLSEPHVFVCMFCAKYDVDLLRMSFVCDIVL